MPQPAVRPYLRRMETLAMKLGVERDDQQRRLDGDAVWDVEKCMGQKPPEVTEYQWKQREIAEIMRIIRDDMGTVDAHGSASRGGKKLEIAAEAKIKNRMRKHMKMLKDRAGDPKLHAAAKRESRQEELQKLRRHCAQTDKMYSNRFRAGHGGGRGDDDEDEFGAAGAAGVAPVSALGRISAAAYDAGGERQALLDDRGGNTGTLQQESGGYAQGELLDPADDPEFQCFYEDMKRHDVAIDAALDRIAAGLSRLHQNALGIRDEIQQQNQHLDQINTKTEATTEQMRAMNRRLKTTIEQVQKDKLCCYMICLLVLLGLLGVLGSQLGVFGSKHK